MDRIEQLEKQLNERANAIIANDPTCSRILGQLDILREANEPDRTGKDSGKPDGSPEGTAS